MVDTTETLHGVCANQAASVLVTSVSKKVPMVNAVRKAAIEYSSSCKVFGADANKECLSRFFVDDFWCIPTDENLRLESVISWCRDHKVGVVFPSRDGELDFWANHRDALANHGISVMVSDAQAISNCIDKLSFYRHFSVQGFPVIDTSEDPVQLSGGTLVVKERFGAGSAGTGINLDHAQALYQSQSMHSPVFQPYIAGDEISADVYVTFEGRVKGVVLRHRDVVLNGESQITTTFRDPALESLCTAMANSAGFRGHVMFQLIIDGKGAPHVVECNCRFGGASTLSIDAGLDSFYWFMLESSGVSVGDIMAEIAPTPLRQIRYAQDKVVAA